MSLITVKDQYFFEYPIIFSRSLFKSKRSDLADICGTRKLLVLVSQSLKESFEKVISSYFWGSFEASQFSLHFIEDGEDKKSTLAIEKICSLAKEFELDRNGVMVAIGGGVLMDMVGFSASIYRRKLRYIRVPTTLLGQVDAGVGIKTAINFKGSKNFIGSFHPPFAVLNDVNFLSTLSEVEVRSGLSEIMKMAVILNEPLFLTLEESHLDMLPSEGRDLKALEQVSVQAAKLMIDQLKGNFYEEDLKRLVDFGHTLSPYFEEKSNYTIKHGIAVGMDMALSTQLAFIKGMISNRDRLRILELLQSIGINLYCPEVMDIAGMWSSLAKIIIHRGALNMVVPTGVGTADFIQSIDQLKKSELEQALHDLKDHVNIDVGSI